MLLLNQGGEFETHCMITSLSETLGYRERIPAHQNLSHNPSFVSLFAFGHSSELCLSHSFWNRKFLRTVLWYLKTDLLKLLRMSSTLNVCAAKASCSQHSICPHCRTSEVTISSKIITNGHPAFQSKQKHAIHLMFYTLNCNNSRGDRLIVEIVLQKGQKKSVVAGFLFPKFSHTP